MITAEIVGAGETVIHLDQITERLSRELNISLNRAALMLMRHVMADKLSGTVLNVRTDRLRSSINFKVDEQTGKSVFAQVGTNVKYGRYWELGFDRKVGAGARGGPGARGGKVLTGKSLETYYAKHSPGMKHYEARSFLRSSLIDKRAEIIEEIDSALQRATKK